MFPGHRHMDSQTQSLPKFMSYPYNCYPSWESVPLDTRVDTSLPPSSFGPWVHNGRYNYSGASGCNSCCMHNHHPPGYYYYSPPYPHIQPSQHLYSYGAHPTYHGAFPYFVSPPCPFEQPRHDYDKAQSHCCGCPNHACQRMDKGVKIEEQKPEADSKGDDSSLIHLPNQHHPLVWFPFNHMKEKEQSKNSESQPACWNEWIPLDRNGLKGLEQPENEHETTHDKVKYPLPRPIIWMPSYNEMEQAVKDLKELNTNSQTTGESSPKLNVIPSEDGNHTEKPGVPEDERQVQGRPESLSRKESRIIPVKQAEESIEKKICIEEKFNEEDQKRDCLTKREKEDGDDKNSRTKTIPVKQVEEGNGKKLSTDVKHNEENNQKNGSTKREKEDNDAKKASGNKKLPPICLRVSPLPRKKSSSGSSPSSSLPHRNVIEKVHPDKQMERPSPKDTICEVPKKVFQVTASIDEVENKTISKQLNCQDVLKMTDSTMALEKHQVNQGNSFLSRGTEASKMSREAEIKGEGDENERNKLEDVECKSSETKEEAKPLSPADAAVLIQSAYRGFGVRRRQPIQKLQKIREVCMQMEDVRKQIQDLEALLDHHDKKKRTAVNENIMNLLLQLDTIQSAHQFVREARKSAARELICMQEKLDALAKQVDSVQVDEVSGGAVCSENGIENVNLQPTLSHCEKSSSQAADDKVSQDPYNVEGSVRNSSHQASNPEISTGSAKLDAGDEEPSNNNVISTSLEVQEEAPLPNKKFGPDGNMLYLANQEPSSEDSAKPSMSEDSAKPSMSEDSTKHSMSIIQGEPEACFIYGNESPFRMNIEDKVVDSQFESMIQGPFKLHQRNEVDTSRLDSEDPVDLTAKSEIHSGVQEFVEHSPGEEQFDTETKAYPIPGEVSNAQEMSVLALAAENEDTAENILQVDAQANNSEEPHFDDANVDRHHGENVRNPIEKSLNILETDPGVGVPENVVVMENILDSPVVHHLNTEISGRGLEEEAISAVLEAPEQGIQLEIMKPKEEEVLESKAPTVTASEIQSVEEVIECDPLLIKVPQQMLENTADIPWQVSSGEFQGVKEQCISLDITSEKDAKPSEENLKISKHHDDCAAPRKETDVVSSDSFIMNGVISDIALAKEEVKLVKENEKLRQMLENLLEEGRTQIGILHELNGRVKDLEKKMSSHRKKPTAKRYKLIRPSSRKLAS